MACVINNLVDVASYAAQIASRGSAKDVNDGRHVVMRDHCHSGASFRLYQAGHEGRRSSRIRACDRDVLYILQRVRAILRSLRSDLVADTILWVHPKRGRSLEAAAQ